jgi:Fur family transcriptional regulator, ferric uptake regulator
MLYSTKKSVKKEMQPEKVQIGLESAESMKTRVQLSDILRKKGFRLTPQREKILDIFYELPAGEHLSAEELQKALRLESSDISLATSYRTLKLLASLGVLRELDFAEDHKHYELARNPKSPHHHIICLDCGKTEEFESEEIIRLSEELAKERGFQIVDVQLKLFAFCDAHVTKVPMGLAGE